jgi:hypothetical protein
MTRDELTDLACLSFSADLVMQSFCHTSAYPKPVDVKLHETLPEFISRRNGVALKPGDGIIHSWLNRMLIPDTVGTGADSHTRFPLGISFPGLRAGGLCCGNGHYAAGYAGVRTGPFYGRDAAGDNPARSGSRYSALCPQAGITDGGEKIRSIFSPAVSWKSKGSGC